LLWLPSFDPTIIVRVERRGEVYLLVASRVTGIGRHHIDQEVHRPLDAREWVTFERYVEEAGFWQMPSESGYIGLDGSQWFLEGADESQYHHVDRWENDPAYLRAGLFLLRLSGRHCDPEAYIS
jgi:hypothetical protein